MRKYRVQPVEVVQTKRGYKPEDGSKKCPYKNWMVYCLEEENACPGFADLVDVAGRLFCKCLYIHGLPKREEKL